MTQSQKEQSNNDAQSFHDMHGVCFYEGSRKIKISNNDNVLAYKVPQ